MMLCHFVAIKTRAERIPRLYSDHFVPLVREIALRESICS